MAISSPVTFIGSVLSFDAVTIEDDVTEATVTMSREIETTKTWGGVAAAAGQLEGEGDINVLYSETSGGPLLTMRDEFMTPTAGGVTNLFEPLGTGTGNERLTYKALLGSMELGGEPDDTIIGQFGFTMSSTPAWTTQS